MKREPLGIARRYKLAGGSDVEGVLQIFERMTKGEAAAVKVIADTARLIAQAISIVAATADPKLVVLGGSIGARPEFASQISDELARLTPRTVEIRPSALANRASVVGAVAVALNRLHEELFGITELSGALPLPAPKTDPERIPA